MHVNSNISLNIVERASLQARVRGVRLAALTMPGGEGGEVGSIDYA